MTRRCSLTGKSVLVGNKVSHSNKKTKKKFQPNLQNVTLLSDVLGQKIRLRVTPNALRSVEINGGIDDFLINAKDEQLSKEALTYKKLIKKAKLANASNQ